MTEFDPTTLARTPQLALTLAEGLLAHSPPAQGKSSAMWTGYATLPLAGLLYAAAHDHLGIDWVLHAAANTTGDVAPHEPGWLNAAQRVADAPVLATALTQAVNLHARQRDRVAAAVLNALAAWQHDRHGGL